LNANGFNINEEALRFGLFNTQWHARFEVIRHEPLIIADGGHNPEGIEAAIKSIKTYFDEKVIILTGVMKDKDYNYIANEIANVGKYVCCITPDNPRALSAEEYMEVFLKYGVEAKAFTNVESALIDAIEYSKVTSLPIITLGSLYMYKDVIEALKRIF
jgi:dihydrofolate synthase/folylpolyglutamate synthase